MLKIYDVGYLTWLVYFGVTSYVFDSCKYLLALYCVCWYLSMQCTYGLNVQLTRMRGKNNGMMNWKIKSCQKPKVTLCT